MEEENIQRKNNSIDEKKSKKAVMLYKKGYMIQDIMGKLNINSIQLYNALDEAGIPRRIQRDVGIERQHNYLEHHKADEILRLYKNGKTKAEISKTIYVSETTVGKIINQAISTGMIEKSKTDIEQSLCRQRAEQAAIIYILLEDDTINISEAAKALHIKSSQLFYQIYKNKKASRAS